MSKNLGLLTAKLQHPVKETAVAQFVSRFTKSVTPLERPKGTERLLVEDETTKMKTKGEEKTKKLLKQK